MKNGSQSLLFYSSNFDYIHKILCTRLLDSYPDLIFRVEGANLHVVFSNWSCTAHAKVGRICIFGLIELKPKNEECADRSDKSITLFC